MGNVSISLEVKAADGAFGSSVSVDDETLITLQTTVRPVLPAGATVVIRQLWRGKATAFARCAKTVCLKATEYWNARIPFQALVVSGGGTSRARTPRSSCGLRRRRIESRRFGWSRMTRTTAANRAAVISNAGRRSEVVGLRFDFPGPRTQERPTLLAW